jgi:serine/threonine protein kinase
MIDESAGDEKNILKFIAELDRKNIIKLCFWFTYDNTINLVFPKYPGTLEDVLLERWGPGRRSQFSSKFRGSRLNHWLWEEAVDIVGALDYVHNPGRFNGENVIMAHFDLKPANILVDKEGHLVITDFGIARIKSLATGNTTGLLGGAGTSTYAPPEGNKSSTQSLNRAYDIWSMGCILLEIILFVLYDKGPKNNTSDVEVFATARLEEGVKRGVQLDQSFWKEGKHGASLKDCVDERLKQLEKLDDAYLKLAVKEIRTSMLNTTASNRHTAKDCHASLRDDMSLTGGGVSLSGNQVVAVGEHTGSPIHQMSVFFDSKDPARLSHPSVDCQLRCFLIRSPSQKRDKWQVIMSYESNKREKEHSDCGYLAEEEFVPISSYINPKIPGTPFQFRLMTIHPQITFKLNDERDFFRIQAAFTRQQVRVPRHGASNIPIKRCWFKKSSMFGLPTRLKVSGCVQIWDQLSEDEYRETIIPVNRRLSNSGSGSGSNSTGYSSYPFPSPTRSNTIATAIQDAAPKQSTKANPTRVAIFLCSDPAQGQELTLITLNMAYQNQVMGSDHICKDNDIPEAEAGNYEACVTFNTLPGHKSFNAGCFREITKEDISGIPIRISPGIPLDPMTLHSKEQDGETALKWLELEFNSKGGKVLRHRV